MQNPDPLAALRPIVLPTETIGWWPLAPGWWFLLCLPIIILIAWLLIRPALQRRKLHRQLQQHCLRLLEEAHSQANSHSDPLYYLQQCNQILKRYVRSRYHNLPLPAWHGDSWITFLQTHFPDNDTNNYAQLFGEQLYKPRADSSIDIDAVHSWARNWVIQHQKPDGKPLRGGQA